MKPQHSINKRLRQGDCGQHASKKNKKRGNSMARQEQKRNLKKDME